MTEDQRIMYQMTVRLRNNEVTLRWTRNQLFFLINSGALSLVLSSLEYSHPLYGIACFAGLIFSVLWVMLVRIIDRWIGYWDNRLADLESLDVQQVTIFRGEEWQEARFHKTTSHLVLLVLSSSFVGIWTLLYLDWFRIRLQQIF